MPINYTRKNALVRFSAFNRMTNTDNTHLLADEVVLHKIYSIRNQKVMLDRDIAVIYGVTTGNLNKAVQRNLKRFPMDFMFRLNEKEFKDLMFQIGISSWGGPRKLPYVFTEQGLAMLSGVLTSERAIATHIQIMRIFTRIRQKFTENSAIRLELEEIKEKINHQDKNIELVFQYLDEFVTKENSLDSRPPVGYKLSKDNSSKND
ncbi:MAG: ORF6N domain-containing protein [Sphingobacteriaceae bacterium]